MPRPHCPRRVDALPAWTYFKPRGVPVARLEEIQLSVDELEALRLADLEGLYHEDAAARMNVSRPTFGRIVEAGRRKVAETLVRGLALRIEGGHVELPAARSFSCESCGQEWHEPFGTGRPEACLACGGTDFRRVDGAHGRPGQRRAGGCGGGRGRSRRG
jgi:predicted DNA-binding protein (UPF0251 family)